MSKLAEQHWYSSKLTWLTVILLPISWLFRLITFLRRIAYRWHIKKSYRFPVPIIVVGNISVGGTGKTPFVIWLASELQKQGYTPGIVSRGVGGEKQLSPYWVTENTTVSLVGDEAILLARRTKSPVVICIDRVRAVRELLAKTKCNIVISDDGLQHYRLQRDVEIALVDGARKFGNSQLIPAGPLREPVSRLQSIDFVVTQGDSESYSMKLMGDKVVSIADETQIQILHEWKGKRVHAVAAIGNPARFFTLLRSYGLEVIEHVFPDHHLYSQSDLDFEEKIPLIMTEKDMVKCHEFATQNMWYVPVDAEMSGGLFVAIMQKLTNGGHAALWDIPTNF